MSALLAASLDPRPRAARDVDDGLLGTSSAIEVPHDHVMDRPAFIIKTG